MKKKSNYLMSSLMIGVFSFWIGNAGADQYIDDHQSHQSHRNNRKNQNYYDGHHPFVGVRQLYQTIRIQEGVKSGSLTEAEANALREQQRAIHRQKNALRADGNLDSQERHQLNVELDRQGENIYQQKRNGDHR